MRIQKKSQFIWAAAIGFAFWILGSYLYHFQLYRNIEKGGILDFETAFQEKSADLSTELTYFANGYKDLKTEDERFIYAEDFEKETGFAFFSFNGDTLDLWSSNRITLPFPSDSYWERHEVLLLENGWYMLKTLRNEERLFVGACLVKNQYNYENEDLVNNFSDEIVPHLKGEITFEDKGYPVHNAEGKVIFSILPQVEAEKNHWLELVIFSCYLLGILILLQLLINAIQKLLLRRPVLLIIIPFGVVALRYLWLKKGDLWIFRKFELFNPELFASSELAPSLGDLIINVAIFYFLVHFLLKRTRNWFEKHNLKTKLMLFVLPLFLASYYVAFQINEIVKSLVNNSKINFDLEHLFDLDIYSFVSITIIGASFYTYFKLIQYIIIQLKKCQFEWNRLSFLWVLTSFTYVLIDLFYFNEAVLTSFWPIFMSGSLLWFHYKEKDYKFIHVISMLAFISFYAAYILQGYTGENELETRKFRAETIAQDKDVFTEIDYLELRDQLKNDRFLLPYLYENYNHAEFIKTIEARYFQRLKDKYQLNFYLFDAQKAIRDDPRNYDPKKFDRIQDIITKSGIPSEMAPNIVFIPDYTEKLSYVSVDSIYASDSLCGFLMVEYRSTKYPDEIGLPSLLLDERTANMNPLFNYSVGKYVNNRLVSGKGDFNFPTVTPDWFGKENGFKIHDYYSHYIHQDEFGNYTVVSKQLSSGLSLFTSFSYLLIIYGVLLLIPLGYTQLNRGFSFSNIKLNVKIQVVLIGLILVTLIAFAIGAGLYVAKQNLESNKDLIKEKIGSVKIELESKLKEREFLDHSEADYLEYLLKKFSNVFVTDINLYDQKGELLASSQPKIYSEGLISRKMNPQAYRGIRLNNQSEFIHEEFIGNLNYLSAYKPILNVNGEFLAYVNVQYISRQHDLENQISGFLLAIINIMVFMLAISTILSITVSNRLIQPLKYIQESLRTVQIGATSKPIEYMRSDEIGELVKEYNKKVAELQKNAEALAKSERESAWREMAKQVAHEIKNPLTPMKLSIQHLSRSVKLADEESELKLQRVTKSLIEQIDALTKIANEFSNFAKMPKAKEIELDLSEVLKNTVSVFAEYDEHTLDLSIVPVETPIIWADKDLLLRVFNNLIKNAIQSIAPGVDGKIDINLTETKTNYLVSIKDNGLGIQESERDRIFVPYFTTKSKGTGLGLAMSKQIVEGMNGEIWFNSEVGVGTTFFLSFPKIVAGQGPYQPEFDSN
jgi:signal transduction histidine kinase